MGKLKHKGVSFVSNIYRKLYCDHYGMDDPGPDYDIHHIDFDRTNNDIDNLIMLPKSLHHKYHWCLNHFNSDTNKTQVVFDAKIELQGNRYDVNALLHLAEALKEINDWIIIKNNADFELYCRGDNDGGS